MSATGRGAKRAAQDYYATPESAFKPMLSLLPRVKFWEPSCGDGRLIKWLRESGRWADGADLSDGVDFLRSTKRREFIITNPPYSIVYKKDGTGFLPHALSLAPEVMFLLRLNFLGAQYRRSMFQANEPSAIFVLSERPKFIKGKSGDACEYGWFYWGHRYHGIKHL